jgi:ribosomal-protein-alanine N-acetyltransferase
MTLADIPAVFAIDRLSFALPWSENAYRTELLHNQNSHFIVALASPEDGGRRPAPARGWLARLMGRAAPAAPAEAAPRQVVGYGGFWYIVDEAHISTIAAHPEWRGRGVGERLLAAMLERALDLGAVLSTLEVRVSNERAQNLYRKHGFEVVGRRKRYYRDNGEDALLMTVEFRPGYRERLRRTLAGQTHQTGETT